MSYLPELLEADASGEIAEIYAEIRLCSGVPYVSTLQRYLATIPGVLQFGWTIIRPAMTSGAAPSAAWKAASDAAPPVFPELTASFLDDLEINTDSLQEIRNIAENFARVSPVNVITGALLEPIVKDKTLPSGNGLEESKVSHPEMLPGMPELPMMDQLSSKLRNELDGLMVPIAGQPFLPALYRHYARWPKFASYLSTVIPKRRTKPDVIEAEKRAINGIVAAGRQLFTSLPKPPENLVQPSNETQNLILEAIHRYRNTSADMICTGQALLKSLPEKI